MDVTGADDSEVDEAVQNQYYLKVRKNLKKILVVDDIHYVVKSISRVLGSQGYLIYTAMSGKDAIEQFENEIPDLVTIDQKLPDMTGFQLLEKLRSMEGGDKLKVVFISAVHAKEEIRTIMNLGIDNYILKPFKQDKLIKVVKKLLS